MVVSEFLRPLNQAQAGSKAKQTRLDPATTTTSTAIMSVQNTKIAANSPSHANPSELEQSISGAINDLEIGVSDLKVQNALISLALVD